MAKKEKKREKKNKVQIQIAKSEKDIEDAIKESQKKSDNLRVSKEEKRMDSKSKSNS